LCLRTHWRPLTRSQLEREKARQNQTAGSESGLPPPTPKGLSCIPRLFRYIPHLENNMLLLKNITKTLIMDYLQVTEGVFGFPAAGSGVAQVTSSTPH